MDKVELKKSVTVNLRCVTQSSKGGVNLNTLQSKSFYILKGKIPTVLSVRNNSLIKNIE